MADLHTPGRLGPMPTNQDRTSYTGVGGPTEAYRHASIAETEDPNIGTPDDPRDASGQNEGQDPNQLLLASDIPIDVWRNIMLAGAYRPDDYDERFNWLGGGTAAGAGLFSVVLPPIPAGQDWMIEAITYATTAGAAVATCTRLDSLVDPGAIIDVNPATAMVSLSGVFAVRSNLNLPEYVPQGRQLAVQFVAAGADTFFARVRYRLRQGEPVKAN